MPYVIGSSVQLACIMVGLPARGKTYIAQKASRYLQWIGIPTRVFNVGQYRRKLAGAHQDHSFFDPTNAEAVKQRLQCAFEALGDMIKWFKEDKGIVGFYDATNSTVARREVIRKRLEAQGIQVMFIESMCDDESLVLSNITQVKRNSPDYAGEVDPETVIDDFRARIAHYETVYETITEDDATFVKMLNVGSRVIINRIQGYLQSRVVYYLMNLHITPRSIFFSRHGESLYNITGKLGGDSDLSPRGLKYAEALPGLIAKHMDGQKLTVWTSTLRRTIQTGQYLPYPKLQWKALDELDAGVCDGLTYEEVEDQYPEDFALRDDDKFNYRYRGGESYRDVVLRLEPVIMELERQHNILIVSHQAVLRCIYAYYLNYTPDELPYIKIPLHTVLKLTPRAYGCDVELYKFDIEAVDTYRANPKRPSSLRRLGSQRRSTSSPTMAGQPPALRRNQLNSGVISSPQTLVCVTPPTEEVTQVSTPMAQSPLLQPQTSANGPRSASSPTSPLLRPSTNLLPKLALEQAHQKAENMNASAPPSPQLSVSTKTSKVPPVDIVNGVGVTPLKPPFSFTFSDAPDSATDRLEKESSSSDEGPSESNGGINGVSASPVMTTTAIPTIATRQPSPLLPLTDGNE
ncbi:Fructose-2,6-bisphosphatase [Dimargaris verticillata]|uniref:fructose-2,6-bisphosphate 2-phosphatase n=1 Tax=Dimargaris verticillata TaxID=2761393 RepID=A0A9W8B8G3_9FUNG|nr:Fructose-2,6-bisphosphatase [Dimargaris verticillata]